MDSDEESSKVYAELTPVMLENSDGERTEVKVPYTNAYDIQNTVDLTSVTPLTYTNTSSRVTFATCNIDSAGSTFTENYENNDDLLVDGTIKVENGDYYGATNGDEICDDEEVNGDEEIYDTEDNAVYRSLQLLYRGLPKEMFINRILSDTASCEIKLGEMRSALFEQLKEADDFPYGLQCMLKRRLYTRSGDSIPVKLSHDIHTLMSVIEGAEYSEMRELLSSGSGRSQRSQLSSSTANDTINHYDCAPEIKVLTESINSMKADMLKMKQSHLAVETNRSKQIDTLKSNVLGLKVSISTLSEVVSRAVTDIRLCAERIESEKSLGVTNLKSEIRLVKENLASIEDTVYNLQTKVASGKATVSQSGKANRKSKTCHTSGGLPRSDAGVSSVTSGADSGSSLGSGDKFRMQTGDNIVSYQDRSLLAEPVVLGSEQQQPVSSGVASSDAGSTPAVETNIARNEVVSHTEGDSDQNSTENVQPQHNFRSEMNMHLSVPTPSVTQNRSYRDAISSSGATNCRNVTGQAIATRVTRNTGSVNRNSDNYTYMGGHDEADFDDDDDDDEGFVQFVKKRSQRYYLGGFKPSITRQRIEKYVNRRGPTVTWVRIWNSRRRPNNVIIRLNVEDNEYARLLESRTFWPRGVTCRPWVNGSRRNTSRNGDDFTPQSDQLSRHIYGRSDIDDYNPFSPLRDYHNID
ncbi:MAG: hypothetical protein AB2693_23335 [Candidatus Thiodiazotropha sp.]